MKGGGYSTDCLFCCFDKKSILSNQGPEGSVPLVLQRIFDQSVLQSMSGYVKGLSGLRFVPTTTIECLQNEIVFQFFKTDAVDWQLEAGVVVRKAGPNAFG